MHTTVDGGGGAASVIPATVLSHEKRVWHCEPMYPVPTQLQKCFLMSMLYWHAPDSGALGT